MEVLRFAILKENNVIVCSALDVGGRSVKMAETVVQFTSDATPTMDGCVNTGCDVSAELVNGTDEVGDALKSAVATSRGGSSGSASLSSCSSHETVVSVGVRQPETRDAGSPTECDQKPEPETVCCNGDQSAESGDEVFHSEMTVMSPLVNRWRRRQQAEAENNSTSGSYLGWSSNKSSSSLRSDPRFVEANSESRRELSTHGYSSDTEAFLRTLSRRGTTSGQSVTVSGRSTGQSPSVEYQSWHRGWPTNLHRTSSPTSVIKHLEVCKLSLNKSSSSSFYFANVKHRQHQVRIVIVAGQQGSKLH